MITRRDKAILDFAAQKTLEWCARAFLYGMIAGMTLMWAILS